jgi:cell division protein FtsW
VLPHSAAINGARRWIQLGGLRFQASEIARIALIVVLARHIGEAGDQIREGKVLMQQLIRISLVCGLVLIEPDFSVATLIGCVGLTLLFVGGARLWHLAGIALPIVPAALIAMVAAPYRQHRLMAFLHMSSGQGNGGYQAHQALIGLGNGGFFGVGLGHGVQKLFYLPEPHTDFVFSILGEEIGFAGLVIVLAVFAFIIYRGVRIALSAPDKMGQLMAFGLTLVLALSVIIHACVNTGLIPTTGVPLPFLSYGGMSLVFTLTSMGILLNISSQANDMSLSNAKRRDAGANEPHARSKRS